MQRAQVACAAQGQKPAFPVQDAPGPVNPMHLGQPQDRVAVDRPGPRAHGQPVQRRIAHRRRNRTSVHNRAKRGTVAQMAGKQPLRQRALCPQDAHQGRIADPVKAIAAQAPVALGLRQGIGRGHLRVRRVKGGVEGRILRQVRRTGRNGLNPHQVRRIVQGRQGHAGGDLRPAPRASPGRSPSAARRHAPPDAPPPSAAPRGTPACASPSRQRRAVTVRPDLADQGLCDLSLTVKDLQLQAKTNLRSQSSSIRSAPSPGPAAASTGQQHDGKAAELLRVGAEEVPPAQPVAQQA